jgi:hypothetical protein
MWPSFLAAWWGPIVALSVASPPPFSRISVREESYAQFFTYFSKVAVETKALFFPREGRSCYSMAAAEGKSSLLLPPTLLLCREKCLHPCLHQHHHHHHHHHHHLLRGRRHPLAVFVDWNSRSSLLNLVHVCA